MAPVNLVDLMSLSRSFLAEAQGAEVVWGLMIPFPHILDGVTIQGPVIPVTVSASKSWPETIEVAS